MICTTLEKIREHKPCAEGWATLLKHLGKKRADSKDLPLLTILESNGLDDTLWALRTVPEHDRLWRKYAVWCARRVRHLMEDQRSLDALDVAWRYSEGQATDSELAAARAAARDAAWAAARDAAWATARDAARDAAWAAARAAARDAAWAAARAAAWATTRAAAWAAARDAQAEKLRQILEVGGWVE